MFPKELYVAMNLWKLWNNSMQQTNVMLQKLWRQ
jgi:hypothetical protein